MLKIYEKPAEVKTRLSDLGIPDDKILRLAVEKGEATRLSFDSSVPPFAVGGIAWGVAVGSLRKGLIPHGFVKATRGGIDVAYNPLRKVAITVATGDEATGLVNGRPATKYKRGNATKDAVEENNAQLSLLSRFSPTHPAYVADQFKPDIVPALGAQAHADGESEADHVMMWVLLTARVDDELRCELSLPHGLGLDDAIHDWAERIVLKPVQVDGTSKKVVTPIEPTPEIDVQVTRKKKA